MSNSNPSRMVFLAKTSEEKRKAEKWVLAGEKAMDRNPFLAERRIDTSKKQNRLDQIECGKNPYPPASSGIRRRVDAPWKYEKAFTREERRERLTKEQAKQMTPLPIDEDMQIFNPLYSGQRYAELARKEAALPTKREQHIDWHIGELQKRKDDEASLLYLAGLPQPISEKIASLNNETKGNDPRLKYAKFHPPKAENETTGGTQSPSSSSLSSSPQYQVVLTPDRSPRSWHPPTHSWHYPEGRYPSSPSVTPSIISSRGSSSDSPPTGPSTPVSVLSTPRGSQASQVSQGDNQSRAPSNDGRSAERRARKPRSSMLSCCTRPKVKE